MILEKFSDTVAALTPFFVGASFREEVLYHHKEVKYHQVAWMKAHEEMKKFVSDDPDVDLIPANLTQRIVTPCTFLAIHSVAVARMLGVQIRWRDDDEPVVGNAMQFDKILIDHLFSGAPLDVDEYGEYLSGYIQMARRAEDMVNHSIDFWHNLCQEQVILTCVHGVDPEILAGVDGEAN